MHFTAQDSFERICEYAFKYQEVIRERGLTKPDASERDQEIAAVLMEKWDVLRLLSHPDCYRLAAIMGIQVDDDGKEQFTISLLAVNRDGEVLPQHKQKTEKEAKLPGEEVWPLRKTIAEFGTLLGNTAKESQPDAEATGPMFAPRAAQTLSIFEDVPYKEVYEYCEAYAEGKDGSETLAVIMGNDAIDKVQKLAAKRVAGVFGMHKGKLTVSLLAMDDTHDVISEKHTKNGEPGQQVWPAITIAQFKDLLPKTW